MDVIGYKFHYGTVSKNYQYTVDVENNTSCSISGLAEGTSYYFAATAYNDKNLESSYSEELAYTIPDTLPPPSPSPVDTTPVQPVGSWLSGLNHTVEPGVYVQADTIEDARSELAEIIEEYVFVSLQEGHPLPEFKNFRKVA
jgi:hypothetical protein